MIAWSGEIHLRLYFESYRHTPTDRGTLAQSVVAFVLAALVLLRPCPIEVGAGALFLLATVGGFLLSTVVGVFRFYDSFQASFAWTAFIDEPAGAAVLCASFVLGVRSKEHWW